MGYNSGAAFNGSASASANYGNANVGASASLTGNEGYLGLAESVAFGLVNDTFDIPGSGSGTMVIGFSYGGSMTVGNPANGGAGQTQVEVQVGSISQHVFSGTVSGTSVDVQGEEIDPEGQYAFGEPVPGCTQGSGSFNCSNATFSSSPLPFTFGIPVTFDFGLLPSVQALDDQTIDSDPPDISLRSIQVYDASTAEFHNPVRIRRGLWPGWNRVGAGQCARALDIAAGGLCVDCRRRGAATASPLNAASSFALRKAAVGLS